MAWAAAAIVALLDAATLVLIIPFLDAVFRDTAFSANEGSPAAAEAGTTISRTDSVLHDLLEGTVYRWIDPGGDPHSAVLAIILMIVAVFAVKNAFAFLRDLFAARLEEGVSRDASRRLHVSLLHADLQFFGRARLGDLVGRLTAECDRLRALAGGGLVRLTSACCLVAASATAMALISWRLTLAAVVVVPLTMLLWGPMLRRLRSRERATASLGAEIAARVLETLRMARVVKSSSAEPRESERFRELTGLHHLSRMRAARLRAFIAPATEMLAALGTVAILWYGARLVVAGEIGGAAFVAFLALAMRIFSPVKAVANFPALAMPGVVAAERIVELLDLPGDAASASGTRRLTECLGAIAFRGVSFAYPGGGGALDLTFDIAPGETVALVGPSGAGKTTTVDLLARFLKPDAGRVTIDGIDTADLARENLRSLMAFVPEGGGLFNDTVRANIAYSRPEASIEEVRTAAKAAFAQEFVERLPGRYDASVGEFGSALSAGERQRIAIARAILADRPILILDEATNALDPVAERAVRAAIAKLYRDRTVIVIAHRRATARMADRVFVMDGGRIVESGTHESLLRREGVYRRLSGLRLVAGAQPAVAHRPAGSGRPAVW